MRVEDKVVRAEEAVHQLVRRGADEHGGVRLPRLVELERRRRVHAHAEVVLEHHRPFLSEFVLLRWGSRGAFDVALPAVQQRRLRGFQRLAQIGE